MNGNEIGLAGARVIAGSPAVADLKRLDLSDNPITPAGRASIFRSPHLRSCEVLVGWDGRDWTKDATAM